MLVDNAGLLTLGEAALGNRDRPDRVKNGGTLNELDANLLAPAADVKDRELESLFQDRPHVAA